MNVNEQRTKRVSFYTLGCRLNSSETMAIEAGFRQRGYQTVPFGESAEVIFINTCTVTNDADRTCRRILRQAHRTNPSSKIIVAGCYAQLNAKQTIQMEGVDLVLGTAQKERGL